LFFSVLPTYTPNVAVERLAHLPRIQKVVVSNLVPETGYPHRGVRGFIQFLHATAEKEL
jgi:hypothetical protein